MGKKSDNREHINRVAKVLLIINFIIFVFAFCAIYIVNYLKPPIKPTPMYVSSLDVEVPLYDENFNEIKSVYRGYLVNVFDNTITKDGIIYKEIVLDDNKYYINIDNLVLDYNKSVKEEKLYLRTASTVYKDSNSNEILGFIHKGSDILIVGIDKLEKGIPNMYKIKYDNNEGYIYSKYLVDTKEKSILDYNENGIYDIHKDRRFSYELYGGSASNLDYYPYEKVSFDNNKLLDNAKTLYLNSSSNTLNNIDEYISLAKESGINAFVVDIKDGSIAYKSDVAKKYSLSTYESTNRSVDEYKKVIKKLRDNNFYVIGRIVVFNDSLFAKDNIDEAISKNGEATSWVSAYSRKSWEYNVSLAIEAVKLFKFNEIQFDYVRFPETSYAMSVNKAYDFKNKYNEEKAEAIQNFIFYATDQIHKEKAYISVDVFGESANTYVTSYGQYWPAISNIVDVISAMPYPDHFNKYDYGFGEVVWTIPYELLKAWGSSAAERQKEIPTPALVRTWIQAYDAIYAPYVTYDASLVSDEIRALYDSNLSNGYITWNSSSSLEKYNSLKEAFMKDYR